MKYRCSNGVWINAWNMQFIKHVEPKFSNPRKPIVVIELTWRRRGYCSSASILFPVVRHGRHDILLFRFLCKVRNVNNIQYEFNDYLYVLYIEFVGRYWPFIHITVLPSVNAFRPAHNSPNHKRNPCIHYNKSFRTVVPRRWYDFVRPNERECGHPCSRNKCNANMSIIVVRNYRTHNTDTIMLFGVSPLATRTHWTFHESHWMHRHQIL